MGIAVAKPSSMEGVNPEIGLIFEYKFSNIWFSKFIEHLFIYIYYIYIIYQEEMVYPSIYLQLNNFYSDESIEQVKGHLRQNFLRVVG
jgi:hypothetical protein